MLVRFFSTDDFLEESCIQSALSHVKMDKKKILNFAIKLFLPHYGPFREFLTQNWAMNFGSSYSESALGI